MNFDKAITKNHDNLLADLPYYEDLRSLEKDITVNVYKTDKGIRIKFDGKTADIGFDKEVEFFRALGLFVENAKKSQSFEISEDPSYNSLGIMLDNSRNAVATVGTVKKLLRLMAAMGFNTLMLYTEDTYEVEDNPYFGHMRGRFTNAEIKEIESYASDYGIELVPCIQTLAHLNAIFKWYEYCNINDITDTLFVGEQETYDFIDKMLSSVSKTFKTRRINLGMDEAFLLGQGKYLKKNGYKPKSEIMKFHLAKVMKLCEKYNFEPMIWSDMFFRTNNPDFVVVDGKLPQAAIDSIPKGVALINWDYVSEDYDKVNELMKFHKLSEREIIFAGGAWKWVGLAPFLEYSFITSRVALKACRENDIKQVIMTAWGDDGGEASTFLILPVMQLYAEDCYQNNSTDEHIKSRLKTCANMDLDDAMLLDLPHSLPGYNKKSGYDINPANYLLFQDILMGLFDKHVNVEEFTTHYRSAVERLNAAAERAGEWGYVYETISALSEVLAIKCGLGIKLKKAYDENDRNTLKNIKDIDFSELLVAVEKLYECDRYQWYKEYKPFGFEVQDIRLGGLIQRIKNTKRCIDEYLSGKIDRIEELEQERLYYDCRRDDGGFIHTHTWRWRDTVTPGII